MNRLRTPFQLAIMFLLTIAFAIAGGGCNSTTAVRVDAIAAPGALAPSGQRYVLVGPQSDDALLDQHISTRLREMLRSHGMGHVADSERPDVALAWRYTVSKPQVKQVYRSEPVYGGGHHHHWPHWDDDCRRHGRHWSGGPIGYRTVRETYTSFKHTLEIRASSPDDNDVAWWRVRCEVQSADADVRRALPWLVESARRHIGRDGGQTIVETIDVSELAQTDIQPR